MKRIIAGFAVAFAIGGGAQAASVPVDPGSAPIAEKVACYWRHGVRVCNGPRAYHRYYRAPAYGYYGYSGAYRGLGRSEDYPVGSTEWWRAKDRECTGGYRC